MLTQAEGRQRLRWPLKEPWFVYLSLYLSLWAFLGDVAIAVETSYFTTVHLEQEGNPLFASGSGQDVLCKWHTCMYMHALALSVQVLIVWLFSL